MGKKKGEKKRSEYFEWIIAAVVLLGYFLIVLLSYYREEKDFASITVEAELAKDVADLSNSVVGEISVLEQATKTAAAMIGEKDISLFSEENLNKLGRAISVSPADAGIIFDTKGQGVYPNGTTVDYRGNKYYNAAMTNETVISEIEYSDKLNEYCYAIYTPINYSDKTIGVMCLIKKAVDPNKKQRINGHDGNTIFSIINSDGMMVATYGVDAPENGTNIYDYLGGKNTLDSKHLAQNIENSKEGMISVQINETPRKIRFCELGVNEWYAVAFFTQKYVDRRQLSYYKNARSVVIKTIVALVAFFAVILFINVFSQRIYNTKNKELQNKAETDLLTGMLNKIATERHIQDYLDNEGKKVPGMLILIDIDNFKKINDTMGHAFGDQVLSSLGQTISNEFRISDIFGRIGGDEFMIYLKNIPNDEIRDKEANKLVNFFKNFQAGDYVKYSVGASIGVSMYPKDGDSFEELYRAADKAVYRSKQEGKNQLRFYSDEDKIVKA